MHALLYGLLAQTVRSLYDGIGVGHLFVALAHKHATRDDDVHANGGAIYNLQLVRVLSSLMSCLRRSFCLETISTRVLALSTPNVRPGKIVHISRTYAYDRDSVCELGTRHVRARYIICQRHLVSVATGVEPVSPYPRYSRLNSPRFLASNMSMVDDFELCPVSDASSITEQSPDGVVQAWKSPQVRVSGCLPHPSRAHARITICNGLSLLLGSRGLSGNLRGLTGQCQCRTTV